MQVREPGREPTEKPRQETVAESAARYEEFLWRVQREAGLPTPEAAALAARATLATLAERLRAEDDPGEETDFEEIHNLLGSLSDRADDRLSAGGSSDGRGGEFSLAEFFRRVGQRTGVGIAEAESRARAVAVALEATAMGSTLDRARSRLPDEFDLLFV